jgi:hypothetical protein
MGYEGNIAQTLSLQAEIADDLASQIRVEPSRVTFM